MTGIGTVRRERGGRRHGPGGGRRGVLGRLAAAAVAAAVLASVPAGGASAANEAARARRALSNWELDEARSLVEELREASPSEPRALTLAGRLRLLEGRYEEALDFLDQAVHLGGETGEAKTYRDLVRATRDEVGDYASHRSEDGRFVIRHAPGVDEVMVPYVEEVLSAAWEQLVPLFGHEPPTPVRVHIYPRVEVLGAVSSLTVDEIKTSGTIALCKYNRLMLTSPRDMAYGYGWADTLAHEFIHLLITQKSRRRVPIWLHEAMAKYYETLWRQGDAEPFEPDLERRSQDLLVRAMENGELISFSEMSPSMAKLPSQEATATAFAEVFTVMGFLEDRAGEDAVRQLIEAMSSGKDDREAVAAVSGVPWERFEQTWRSYLEGLELKRMEDVFDQKLIFDEKEADEKERQALKGEEARKYVWLGDRMKLEERYRASVAEYRKAVERVGNQTPLIQAKLGGALLELGRVEEAVEALEPPLPLYPEYMLLRAYLGEAHVKLGNVEQAREHLEWAIRINPFDPDLHGHLATVYDELGLTERAEREERAHRLVNRER